MLWPHISDLVEGKSVPSEFIPKLFAYVEVRATYETLARVLDVLYKARSKGLVDEKLIGVFDEWLRNVEEEYYYYGSEIDGAFTQIIDSLEKLSRREKGAGLRRSDASRTL